MSTKFKILFLGVKRIGTLSLKTLIEADTPLAGVVTMESKENLPIVKMAKDAGIPVFQNPTINSSPFLEVVRKSEHGRVLAFSYPRILKKDFINLFKYGCINFHPARLPNYRGCLPTVWPILEGDSEACLTMHYMDEGIDTGDIIDTWKIPIDNGDTGYSLYEKLVNVVPLLLKKHIPDIFMRNLSRIPQDHSKARYFSKKLPNNGQIDWSWNVERVTRFVRALYHPFFESAHTIIEGKKLEILEVSIAKHLPGVRHKPKTFIFNNDRLLVACKNGYIEIKKIKHVSGKEISEKLATYFNEYISRKRENK